MDQGSVPLRTVAGNVPYIRVLDGFRGIAILIVVLFHYKNFGFGWAGVQLFFVLSGFLITSLLLEDLKDLRLSDYLKRFYWRRGLRVFPLYYFYLALIGTIFLLTAVPVNFGLYWRELLTYTLNVARMSPAFQNDSYLTHFWSLAVEEQFYLVWPLFIYFTRGKHLLLTLVAILAGGPVIRAVTASYLFTTGLPAATVGQSVYSLTFCQIDAFAAGGLVAVIRGMIPARYALAVFGTATVLILGLGELATLWDRGTLKPNMTLGYQVNLIRYGQHIWGYTLINLWSASVILLACKGHALTQFMGNPGLVYIGKISYGMYVYHLLVQEMVITAIGEHWGVARLGAFALYLGSLILVCSASYYWFERPFLRMKDRYFTKPSRTPQMVPTMSQVPSLATE